jgi:hypothetical protein
MPMQAENGRFQSVRVIDIFMLLSFLSTAFFVGMTGFGEVERAYTAGRRSVAFQALMLGIVQATVLFRFRKEPGSRRVGSASIISVGVAFCIISIINALITELRESNPSQIRISDLLIAVPFYTALALVVLWLSWRPHAGKSGAIRVPKIGRAPFSKKFAPQSRVESSPPPEAI